MFNSKLIDFYRDSESCFISQAQKIRNRKFETWDYNPFLFHFCKKDYNCILKVVLDSIFLHQVFECNSCVFFLFIISIKNDESIKIVVSRSFFSFILYRADCCTMGGLYFWCDFGVELSECCKPISNPYKVKRNETKRITCDTNKIGWISQEIKRGSERERKVEMEYRCCHTNRNTEMKIIAQQTFAISQ